MPSCPSSMPSSSGAQSIPAEATPRRVATSITLPPAMALPGTATGTIWSTATLGAPVTMVSGTPPPTSTVQISRLSACGCFSRWRIRPATTPRTPWLRSCTASTVTPRAVSLAASSAGA